MDIDGEKKELREKYLALRKMLPRRELHLGTDINEALKDARVIFCYVSFGSEIATHSFIGELIAANKIVVVPRCDDLSGSMSAVAISSLSELSKGAFGILEPCGKPVEKTAIDAAVIPGAAFDMCGFRLGYGKGYYDRFLAGISPIKIGVCHRELYVDRLPHTALDINADTVVRI